MDTYISQHKSQLLDSLENQVKFSQLVAVIVGDKGVGKSFLLDQLLLRSKDDASSARIDASLAMTVEQLAQAISLQLGLSWNGDTIPLEQRINNELEQKAFIAIDDAHLLSDDCLNYLLKLNQNQLSFPESILFIMLVGQDSLPAMIENTHEFSLHHEMCVVLTLEPIEKNETQAMVASLGHCDFEHVETLFDEKKLHYFWQLSKGNPSELDYHISRWLQENNPIRQVELTTKPKGSIAKSIFYTLLVIALASVLVYQEEINHWITQDSQIDAANIEKNSQQADIKAKQIGLNPTLVQQQDKDKQQPLVNQSKLKKELRETNNISSDAVIAVNPLMTKTNSSKIDDKSVEETAKANHELPAQANIQPKTKSVPAVKKQAIKIQLNAAENWLLAQPAGAFSLQWVGLSTQQSAKEFIAAHPLADELKIYRRITKGKILYLVVNGRFASRLSAAQAIDGYRKQGIKSSPWVKPLSAIQTEIKAFQSAQR
ncbi:MAG: AAA family ATPase [Enterobacterales bacterium]|nr:AAA family ATPase [Enterobacterales bacterium]